MEAFNITVAEVEHASEMQADLRRKMRELHKRDAGQMDSLRAGVLGMVVAENYERAKVEIETYVEAKSAYPAFQERVARYVQHCVELVNAIETKRNFPGLAGLSLAKQQELHDRVLEHFEDLKANLKQIEGIERDHKLTDVRSTIWVIQSLSYTVAAITVTAFFMDLKAGLLSSAIYVGQLWLDDISTIIVSYLPFL